MDRAKAQEVIERHFRVYETQEERFGDAVAQQFFLLLREGDVEEAFERCRQELLALDRDAIVFLRRQGGEDILVVAERPPVATKRPTANIVLLILTLMTTMAAGAVWWASYKLAGQDTSFAGIFALPNLGMGALTFALPLMLILGVHETAHFVAAKRHGLRATLPYFIPFPPVVPPLGTLGAFISLRDPLPDRKALFDVGASGPLAGFALAVPVLVLGLVLSDTGAAEVPDLDRPEISGALDIDESTRGRTVLSLEPNGTRTFEVTSTAKQRWDLQATAVFHLESGTNESTFHDRLGAGETRRYWVDVPDGATRAEVIITWDDRLLEFGDPLLIKGLQLAGIGDGDYMTHPTMIAGWVGLLVTGINLLPAGQLDGGHVARAVMGDRMRFAAFASVALLAFLAVQFQAWLLMALFILLMGVQHPPPLNDRSRLDGKRKALAVFVLVVFLVTFVPVPVHI